MGSFDFAKNKTAMVAVALTTSSSLGGNTHPPQKGLLCIPFALTNPETELVISKDPENRQRSYNGCL